MDSNLAKVGGICVFFAMTFALGSLGGQDDHLNEEKFRKTISGRLSPKLSYEAHRRQQKSLSRGSRILSLLLFAAGSLLLLAAGVAHLLK